MRAVLTTTPNTTLTHTMQRYQATTCVNCQRVKCNSGTEIVHSINHVYYLFSFGILAHVESLT